MEVVGDGSLDGYTWVASGHYIFTNTFDENANISPRKKTG
jgi:hypothetical protein